MPRRLVKGLRFVCLLGIGLAYLAKIYIFYSKSSNSAAIKYMTTTQQGEPALAARRSRKDDTGSDKT
jgi:hypothetical protein